MLPPHSSIVLAQLIIIGLLDATYTAFRVPIAFALPFDLNPASFRWIAVEIAGTMLARARSGLDWAYTSTSC